MNRIVLFAVCSVLLVDAIIAQSQSIQMSQFERQLGTNLGDWILNSSNGTKLQLSDVQMQKIKTVYRARADELSRLKPTKSFEFEKDEFGSNLDHWSTIEEKISQAKKKFHNQILQLLNDQQNVRLTQILLQLDGASRSPFYYFKNKEFLAAANFDSKEYETFDKYLNQIAGTEFNQQIDRLAKKHRANILRSFSDETRARIKTLVGSQIPIRLIPQIKLHRCVKHFYVEEVNSKMIDTEMSEEVYRSWSRLLVNRLVTSEIEWLDEQHQNHLRILEKCFAVYRMIPKPRGEKFQVGPNTYRELLDQADVDAYNNRVKAEYKKHHDLRMELLLPHQKQRLYQLIRQSAQKEKSVFAYLGDERLLKQAKVTGKEKKLVRKTLKEETRKMQAAIRKLIEKQTDEIYRQVPDDRRQRLKKLFGAPIEFAPISALTYHSCYFDREKNKQVWDAMTSQPRKKIER